MPPKEDKKEIIVDPQELERLAKIEQARIARANELQRIQLEKEAAADEDRRYHLVPTLHPHPIPSQRVALRAGFGIMPNGSYRCAQCSQIRYEYAHVCLECKFTVCPECFQKAKNAYDEDERVKKQNEVEEDSTLVRTVSLPNAATKRLPPDMAMLPPLLRATVLGDVNKVIELLDKNEFRNDLDLEVVCPSGCYSMKTALLLAAECGQPLMTFHLLNKGAKINAQDFRGYTPLMHASFRGHVEVMDELLYKGVDTEVPSQRGGYTALHLAAAMGHAEAVSRLLDNGSFVNAKTHQGRTALIIAALNGYYAVASKICAHKDVDLHAKDLEGYTACVAAAAKEHYAIAEMLNAKIVTMATTAMPSMYKK